MNQKIIVLSLIILMTSITILAQNTDTIPPLPKAQATFIYPWGTNGAESLQKANNFSFNLLYGINGGLNGTEIGGLGNHNVADVFGAQFAGIANVTKGKMQGAAFAGVINVSTDSVKGALFSGCVNYYQNYLQGSVFSTVNIGVGELKGAQFGVVNMQSKSIQGSQIGVVNYVTNISGTQIGVVNVSDSLDNSFQLGVVNYATKAKGSQLGVVNVVGKNNGVVPIGILSVVGGGYYGLEVSTNELYHTTVQYKMGVDAFYNIFSAGLLNFTTSPQYSLGYGIGTQKRVGKRHIFGMELVAHNLIEDNKWDRVNILGQINLDYSFFITKNIGITFGPSINGYYTEVESNGTWGTIDMPYKPIAEHQFDYGKLTGWFGLNAGITIRF